MFSVLVQLSEQKSNKKEAKDDWVMVIKGSMTVLLGYSAGRILLPGKGRWEVEELGENVVTATSPSKTDLKCMVLWDPPRMTGQAVHRRYRP